MIATTLSNRYRVVSQLGKGGMGTVYLAHDPLLDREVAVKVLSPLTMSANADERFRAEARIVAGMDHPGIVPVYDFGEHDGSVFIVMAYVPGANLRIYIQETRLTASEILQVAIQAAEALHHSHQRGVVHRDVKPENIIVTRESSGIRARITDFGLAVSGSQDRFTNSGSLVGTLAYLSPEQIAGGAIDARSDIYSLGAVLYECLAGKPPIEGDFPGMLYSVLHETPKRLATIRPDLPEGLSELVMTLLAKAPADRIESAADLAIILRDFIGSVSGRGGTKQEPSPEKRTARFPRVVRVGVSLVGRQEEFEELQRRVTASLLGECQLVLIGGEAGIGKSRLVEEIQRLARVRDVATYRGRFIEQDRGFPYQAFGDILHEFFTRHGAALPDFADLLPDLISLFPVLTEVPGIRAYSAERLLTPRAAEDQTHVFELLAKTIARIGDGKPLLLTIENMHAADISVQALQYFLRRLPNLPLVLVGTYRSSELDRRHPIPRLIQNLRGEKNFSSLTLTGFSEGEQRIFIESLIGAREIEEELAARLHAATEGNPYFTSELVRSLIDSGAIAEDEDGIWRIFHDDALTPEKLPETIHQVVERRLDKLDDEARSLLATASVLGRTFELSNLEYLAGRSADLDAMIESLVAEGILEEERELRGDHFSFVSNVFRDVVYTNIPRRKRKALHLRFAQHLEEQYGGRIERAYAELLHHFASADAAEKVIDYGPKAAQRYLDAFSALDAIRVLRLTLDFVSDEGEDLAIEAKARECLAEAYRMAGQDEAALQELSQAARILETLGSRKELTRIFASAADLAWETRQVEAAAAWIDRGLTIRDDADVATLRRLYSLGATVANLAADTQKAQAYLQAAALLLPQERRSPSRHVSSGVLQIPMSGDVTSLDPSLTFTLAQTEAIPNIFESLTREAEGARAVPWLAEDFTIEGTSLYRFRLQRNLHFQDGRRVRSRDVLYSFNRLLSNPLCECRFVLSRVMGAADVIHGKAGSLAGFTAVSDEDFTIELAQPVAFFPALLTNIAASIVPEGLENFVGTWRDGVVGTGPYRVLSFDPGRQLELEANPYYWRQELPRCKHLTFTFGLSPVEILTGFRSGHYSIASDLIAADVDPLRRDPRFARNYRETPRLATYFLALNSQRGPLVDEGLRHRLIQSIDVRGLLKRAVGRLGVPAHGIIPPGLLGYDSSRTSQRFKRADPVGDLRLSAMFNSAYRHAYSKFATLLLENLNEVGVQIEVVEGSSENFQGQAEALGRVDLVLTRWIADYPDAHDFVSFLHSEKGYVGKLCGRPDIDRLIEKGETESNSAIRREIYREVEVMLRRHALLLPLFHEQSYRFARPEIEGFDLNFFSPVVPYERIWFGS
ncbi:MAG TPA: ABC transporter substrate-binding protein [Thermoanaerobaculia bacterium]|nr:ABC transporter substrate-binding protein [Thermoanaerobaculia bacterium]